MKKEKNDVMKKSPALYIIMIIIWTILTVLLWVNFFKNGFLNLDNIYNEGFTPTEVYKILSLILLIFNAIFIYYFWLNGVKDFIYVVWYYIFKNRMLKTYHKIIDLDVSNVDDKVLMIYCTCNDFDGNSLLKCMNQDYSNYDIAILDDSTKEEYKNEIDEFGKKYDIKVVRRDNNFGFKAGNINHYLQSEECKSKGYKYFVVLDSDEIIPHNFIQECLKYFYSYDNIGIVQANHISTRNRNFFMDLFHIGVNSHWPTYQTMKHFYGFSTMLGHGAMIKMDCYEKAGGFPNLVAEDLCLSIEARRSGYYVAFAENIICEEEYPIDYIAFKKRHSKWTQGNLEFIKRFTKKIIKSPMKWYEKMDIVLFTYNLPLTAIFAFFIFVNLIFVPLLHLNLGAIYGLWMLIPTIIFFFSPMLNDIITWVFRMNPLKFLLYFFCVIILYGSMLTTSLISAVLGIFGKKAKFIVTPKKSDKMTIGLAIKSQLPEFIFSTVLILIALAVNNFRPIAILSVILIISTGYLSVILLFFSNVRYGKEKTAKVDEKTKSVSLRINNLFDYTLEKEQQAVKI